MVRNTQKIAMLFTALVLSLNLGAQGIEFFHGSFADALEKAKSDGKLIFVDAFAEWCGPCKRMAAQTFPDPKVGEYFNANFICLKIDMEKSENADFAGKFPVNAYPTLMFIDQEGKLAAKQTGALGVDALLEYGQKVIGKNDKTADLQKLYDEGKRDPEFLFNYMTALNRAGKPSLKVANDYLNTQSDLNTPFNLKFVLEGTTEADSRVFDLLIKNRQAVEGVSSRDAVNQRIEKACQNTVKKAIEFKDEKLLDEAKSKMKAHYPEKSAAFARDADTKYSAATRDSKQYLKTMKTRQKAVGDNAARLHDLCIEMVRTFPTEPKVLKQAEKWASEAAKKGGLPEYYLTLADIYKRLGNKEKAKKAAEDARKAIGEKDSMLMGQKIDYFLHSLD